MELSELENELEDARILMHNACAMMRSEMSLDFKASHLFLLGVYLSNSFSRKSSPMLSSTPEEPEEIPEK